MLADCAGCHGVVTGHLSYATVRFPYLFGLFKLNGMVGRSVSQPDAVGIFLAPVSVSESRGKINNKMDNFWEGVKIGNTEHPKHPSVSVAEPYG